MNTVRVWYSSSFSCCRLITRFQLFVPLSAQTAFSGHRGIIFVNYPRCVTILFRLLFSTLFSPIECCIFFHFFRSDSHRLFCSFSQVLYFSCLVNFSLVVPALVSTAYVSNVRIMILRILTFMSNCRNLVKSFKQPDVLYACVLFWFHTSVL